MEEGTCLVRFNIKFTCTHTVNLDVIYSGDPDVAKGLGKGVWWGFVKKKKKKHYNK